jgi:hypothetical protein
MVMSRGWVAVVALALFYGPAGCGSSTSSGDGGAGGEGGGGAETCGPAVCGQGERCFDVCGTQPLCSIGSITCGEHDFGACGCDGVAYETLCDLDAAAVGEGQPGSCDAPANHFACEALLCRIDDHVCVTGSSPYCFARDTSCSDCSCVDVAEYCSGGGTCEDVSAGGVAVTCD